jgi:hypothetical protein
MHKPLDLRTLNRTLLARQLLLERRAMPAQDAVAHLLGLQSQQPTSPYPGLWSRLDGFRFGELGSLLTGRTLVRLVLMRGTVHLVTAADALRLRPWLQPMLDRGLRASQWAAGCAGVDRATAVAYSRALLADRPLSSAELRAGLAERFPDADPLALLNALRLWAPLVQVPPRGLWGQNAGPRHAMLDAWVGAPLAEDPDLPGLVRRYLAAFGPATPADMQKWSGRTGLKQVFAGLPLRTYTAEDGRVLYDLPDAELADGDRPVTARLVADFDNLLLSHADRARILAPADRSRVISVNGMVKGTVLVDGFVGGTWQFAGSAGGSRPARGRGGRREDEDTAAISVTPFAPLRPADRDALEADALRLLAAAHPDAPAHAVRFTAP